MSCMYCTFDMLYIYLRLLFGIACLAYHTAIKFALYQLLYPEFIVNSFDIKRAAATFVQFACTLHGKHKYSGLWDVVFPIVQYVSHLALFIHLDQRS